MTDKPTCEHSLPALYDQRPKRRELPHNPTDAAIGVCEGRQGSFDFRSGYVLDPIDGRQPVYLNRRDQTTWLRRIKNRRFDRDVIDLMRSHARRYASPDQPTLRQCYKCFQSELADLNKVRTEYGKATIAGPSFTTFARRVRDLDPYEVASARHGGEAARRMYRRALS